MAGRRVKYGFELNATRDGYEVDEERMRVVRRIFRMVGVERTSLNAVYKAFEREGIPTPGGGKRWDRTFFRTCILDDAYKPHTFEEIEELVSPEVAARLDREHLYGVWWFNRMRVRTRQVSEATETGRRYRREQRHTLKPKEEWVAVPVPYAGIPRGVVEAARVAIKNNRAPAKAGRRFWELSGGILRCEVCGNTMTSRSTKARAGTYYHHYYQCRTHHLHGKEFCTNNRYQRAENLEGPVWELVCSLLRDPDRLRAGLDEMIEAERAGMRGDPAEEVEAWLDKLAALDRKRSRLQDMAAEDYITFEELGAKLREIDEAREVAEQELRTLQGRCKALEELKRDKEALLEEYAGMVPEALEELTGEERHQVYRMLRLKVYADPNGNMRVEGVISSPLRTSEGTQSSTRERTGNSLSG